MRNCKIAVGNGEYKGSETFSKLIEFVHYQKSKISVSLQTINKRRTVKSICSGSDISVFYAVRNEYLLLANFLWVNTHEIDFSRPIIYHFGIFPIFKKKNSVFQIARSLAAVKKTLFLSAAILVGREVFDLLFIFLYRAILTWYMEWSYLVTN